MKVFLTGGTGFIGQPLTKALLAKGWEVVALSRKPDGTPARALDQLGAECVRGEITDRESMRACMTGADLVIQGAGHYEFGVDAAGKRRMQAVNVDGTRNVLDLALELGVPHSIHISTVVTFGDSGPQMRDEAFERCSPCRTTYDRTKTEAHAIARSYQQRGLPLIIVCPSGVIGPNDHSPWGYYLRAYLNRVMPPMCWSANCIFSLVEVNDLAKGIALAAERGRPGETYFFTGEPKCFREHVGFWFEKPGAFRFRAWLPVGFMASLLRALEPLQRAAGLSAFMSRETVLAAATNLNYSSMKAQQELGWTHCTAQEMWFKTIDAELDLLRTRKKRDLVSRLNPV